MPIAIPAARQKLIERIATTSRALAQARRSAARGQLHPPVLPRRRGRGSGRVPQRGAGGSRAGAPAFRVRAQAGATAGSRLQRRGSARRLDLTAHRRRSNGRGHAVPGRLARHGADAGRPHHSHDGAPGARGTSRPSRARCSSSRESDRTNGPFRRESWQQHSRSTASATRSACASWSTSYCARSTTCRQPWPTGRRCASVPTKSRRRSRAAHRRQVRSEVRGDQGAARVDGRQPLHVPRLSPVSSAARPHRRPARAAARNRPGHPARAAWHTSRADHADRRGARARAHAGPADDHQSELDVDRASLDLSRLRRREDFRQRRPRHRREALPRAVHLRRLQPQSARNSAAATQDRQRRRALRPRSRQPRRQGRRARAGDLSRATSCSRRACPSSIRIVRGIVNLYERQRVRVFLRRDAFGRFYSALIYVPRDRYNTQVRQRMEVGDHPAPARDDHRVAGAAVGFGAGARAHDHSRAGRQLGVRRRGRRSNA